MSIQNAKICSSHGKLRGGSSCTTSILQNQNKIIWTNGGKFYQMTEIIRRFIVFELNFLKIIFCRSIELDLELDIDPEIDPDHPVEMFPMDSIDSDNVWRGSLHILRLHKIQSQGNSFYRIRMARTDSILSLRICCHIYSHAVSFDFGHFQ